MSSLYILEICFDYQTCLNLDVQTIVQFSGCFVNCYTTNSRCTLMIFLPVLWSITAKPQVTQLIFYSLHSCKPNMEYNLISSAFSSNGAVTTAEHQKVQKMRLNCRCLKLLFAFQILCFFFRALPEKCGAMHISTAGDAAAAAHNQYRALEISPVCCCFRQLYTSLPFPFSRSDQPTAACVQRQEHSMKWGLSGCNSACLFIQAK